MWRVAVLRESAVTFDDSLQVIVEDKEFQSRDLVPPMLPKQDGKYDVLGRVCFWDSKKSSEIVRDFGFTYPGASRFDTVENGFAARYHSNFKSTLPHSFIAYFSARAQEPLL